MGMATKPPNMAIIFESVSQGSLYDNMHTNQRKLDMNTRLRIARDVAGVMDFLHQSGIVH